MHIQRVHHHKLLLLLFFTCASIYALHQILTHNHFFHPLHDSDPKSKSRSHILDENRLESLSWTALLTCPVCLGDDICDDLQSGSITVGVFPTSDSPSQGGSKEYLGLTKDEIRLSVLVPDQHNWDTWDDLICRNSSQAAGCKVSEAVKGSFLAKIPRGPATLLHNLGVPTGWSPHALTACATSSLAADLREVFDQDKSGAQSPEEKYRMLSTVAVAPGLAMLRIGEFHAIPYFPRYLGACGRVAIAEGQLAPLTDKLASSWDERSEIALQILSIIGGMLTGESLLLAWDLNWDSFAVRPTGQVVLKQLDRLTSVEKRIITKPKDDERDLCNESCFLDFKKAVFQPTPRGQPGKGCSDVMLYGDMMFYYVCRNIFRGNGEQGGLLAGGEERIQELLANCTKEQERGQRWRMVDTLVSILTGEVVNTTSVPSSGEKEEVENVAKEIFDPGEEVTEAEEELYEDTEE